MGWEKGEKNRGEKARGIGSAYEEKFISPKPKRIKSWGRHKRKATPKRDRKTTDNRLITGGCGEGSRTPEPEQGGVGEGGGGVRVHKPRGKRKKKVGPQKDTYQ